MSYTSEREQFLVTMAAEGLPVSVGRQILAMANRLQVISELSCSSEAADRDRVPCPGIRSKKVEDCICDMYRCACGHTVSDHSAMNYGKCDQCECKTLQAQHESVPRIDVQEMRIRRRLDALLVERAGFKANYQGDPRGAVVKLTVPSGKTDDWGRVGVCVPAKGLPASFWERNR